VKSCRRVHSPTYGRSWQRPEEGLQVRRQLSGGLHRREVLAALELGPVRVGGRGDQLAYRLVGAKDRETLRYSWRRAPSDE
jgi:hypothetical protein